MENCTEHCITLKVQAQFMHTFLRFSMYAVIYKRGIAIDEGYTCVMEHGHPLIVPKNAGVRSFIDVMVEKAQDLINKKTKRDLTIFFYDQGTFEMVERWVFHAVPIYKPSKRPLNKLRKEMAAINEKIAALAPLKNHCYFLLAMKKNLGKSLRLNVK
ncbi:uncharacterized protein LOC125762294 [Anopheles funestus]|uniref:uncharacterized protein LOC125762294 n=1 Tax=Anopheles funestus TaxID=62324 RepID=UPI0020C6F57D|nr:uncharacterized protein LOC125762294 [Anopheles funestus]